MASGPRSVRVAVFGPFRFDPTARDLRKHNIHLRLEEKPALVLQRLIESSGTVVSRKELQEFLWPNGIHVDFNHGLNKSINRLRAVLGDDCDQPRYIETLNKRGYRFVADVQFFSEQEIVNAGEKKLSLPDSVGEIQQPAPANYSSASMFEAVPNVQSRSARNRPAISFRSAQKALLRAGLVTAAVLAIGLVLGAVRANRIISRKREREIIILPPEVRMMSTSENLGLAISPDGTQIVFSGAGRDGQPRLWLRRLDASAPEPISGTEGGAFPFWSPDGKDFGFFAGLELKRANLANHSVTTICAVESGRGGSWSRDGVILFSPGTRGPIYKISASGGKPSPETILDESRYTTHRWPEFLPDGKHFVYLAVNHDKSWVPGAMFLASLEGGQAKFLGESDSNVIPMSGSLLFLSHGKLMSQAMRLEENSMDSRADIVAEAVGFDAGLWHGNFTASAAKVVYRPRTEKQETSTIAWFDRAGNKLEDAGPPGIYREVALAPSGGTIAAVCGDPQTNICLIHSDGTVTQVTHGGINGRPVWANDSTFFSYYLHRGRTDYAITIKALDAKISGRVLVAGRENIWVTSWHPDKRHALVLRDIGNGAYQYIIFDLATNRMTPYLPTDVGLTDYARFSPDGHWVAYSKKSNGRNQLHIASYPVPSQNFTLANIEGIGAKWRSDSNELYFLGPGENLYAVSVAAANGRLNLGKPHILFHPAIPPAPWDRGSFDVSPDGKRFLLNAVSSAEPSQLVLTSNWQH